MAQLENIIRIQERIELSTNGTTQKISNTASREANNKLKPVAYIVPEDGVEVKLQSSLSSSATSTSVRSSQSAELSSSMDLM